MEINLVYREIQQLLIKDENVTLPEVGKFEIVSTPATFLEDCRTILPPKKELLFSSLSDQDKNRGCEPWQKELAEEICSQLTMNGVFEVPGFGAFRQSETGEISFEVSPEFDFAPDSFSLDAISLEVNQVQPVVQPTVQPVVPPAVQPDEQKSGNKWLVWALVAAIAVLAIILFVILFKEQFAQMLRNLLYTEEELQIIEQWRQGYNL